ncbi:unnamed protein product, partial [Adineta steineri]
RGPKHQIFDRRSNELRPRGYNRLRQMSTINFDKQEYSLEKHSKFDKKNIKLIPINPDVCFATTTSGLIGI